MGDKNTLTNVIPKADLICRACCAEGGTLSPVWSATRRGSLHSMITFCTGIEIKRDDGKPNQICQSCIDHLHIAYDFKTTCLKSNDEFIKLLYGVSNHPIKISKDKTGIKTEDHNDRNIFNKVKLINVNDEVEIPNNNIKVKVELDFKRNGDVYLDNDDEYSDEDVPLAKVKNEPVKKIKKHLSSHDGHHESNSDETIKPGDKVYFRKDALITDKPPPRRSRCLVANETEKKVKTKKVLKESEMKVKSDNKNDVMINIRSDDGDRLQRRRLTLVLKQFAKKCSVCDLTFASVKACKQHKLEVHGGEASTCVCDLCGKECRLGSFRSHYGRHFKAPLACSAPGCSFREHAPNLVRTHEARVHGMHNLAKLQCPSCPQQFNYSGGLYDHIKRVHGNMKKDKLCPDCGAAFFSKAQLARHLQRHQGEKSLSCPVCGALFGYRNNLRVHALKYHDLDIPKRQGGFGNSVIVADKTLKDQFSTEKTEKCPHCNFTSSSARAVRVHVQSVHCTPAASEPRARKNKTPLEEGEQSNFVSVHKCPQCPARLSRGCHLRRHLRNVHGATLPSPARGKRPKATLPSLEAGTIISVAKEDSSAPPEPSPPATSTDKHLEE